MARVEEVERRLTEWADWKRADGQIEGTARTVQPPTARVRQIDCLVAALPKPLHATLTAFYVVRGPIVCQVKQLGCPETTIMRRIGRVHLLIADRLVVDRDRDRQELHRSLIAAAGVDEGPKTSD